MKNNVTELVFILDRSGSMSGFEADTIGGFNATIVTAQSSRVPPKKRTPPEGGRKR